MADPTYGQSHSQPSLTAHLHVLQHAVYVAKCVAECCTLRDRRISVPACCLVATTCDTIGVVLKHAVMCYNEPTAVNAHRHRLMRLCCCTALSAHSACYFNGVLPLRAWFYELLLPWAASVARWHCKACSFHCNVRWQVFYSASAFNQSIGSWDAGRAMSLFQVEFDSRFLVCCMRHACFLSHIVYCMA